MKKPNYQPPAQKTTTFPVPRLWPGETVVCIASGPSLTPTDVESVRGKARVIVVNASYALAPWADVLHCADADPFRWYWDEGPKGYEAMRLRDFPGLKFSFTNAARRWGAAILGRGASDGLSLDPSRVCLADNSGYQAINIAVLMGASRIVLLGYDMQRSADGRKRWHADHGRKPHRFDRWLGAFDTLVEPLRKAGVEVVNCSRETALACFPRASIDDAFARRAA